jgi:uncharacterized protein with ParB-like and HNH nuclease domain
MSIKSYDTSIYELIMNTSNIFHIPIYQRSYTWEARKEVEKLIDDIMEFGEECETNDNLEYYIGNIIVKSQPIDISTDIIVIDGQQRITTMVIVLSAIRDICLHKLRKERADKFANNIARALYHENDGKIIMKVNNMEHQSILRLILSGKLDLITDDDKQSNYYRNYKYLYSRLHQSDSRSFIKFVNLFKKIKIVQIILDHKQDENTVFESINSLGRPLSGADLIKNYLFTFKDYSCSQEEESDLIDLYTTKFEKLFSNEKNIPLEIQKFYRAYVAIHTSNLVKSDPKVIYYSLKKILGEISSFGNCKRNINDIIKWGVLYQAIRVGNIQNTNSLHIEYLRTSFNTYSILLLDLLDKTSNVEGQSVVMENSDMFNSTLKKIMGYDISRTLSGFSISEVSSIIAKVPSELKKINNQYYLNYDKEFEDFVTLTFESYQQPTIEKLRWSISNVNLFKNKNILIKLFFIVENISRKKALSFSLEKKNCRIEHIMPLSLNDEWSHISADTHAKYVNTLGNLTITFDKINYSDYGFERKKGLLISKSNVNINTKLSDINVFDDNSIVSRGNELLDIIIDEFSIKGS